MRKLVFVPVLLGIVACSGGSETNSETAQQTSDAGEQSSAIKQSVDRSEKPELSAEAKEETLSIREAAAEAAALVEADANEEILNNRAKAAAAEASIETTEEDEDN